MPREVSGRSTKIDDAGTVRDLMKKNAAVRYFILRFNPGYLLGFFNLLDARVM
jgi:hypothetical protein